MLREMLETLPQTRRHLSFISVSVSLSAGVLS
jgi:hypothetical protein